MKVNLFYLLLFIIILNIITFSYIITSKLPTIKRDKEPIEDIPVIIKRDNNNNNNLRGNNNNEIEKNPKIAKIKYRWEKYYNIMKDVFFINLVI